MRGQCWIGGVSCRRWKLCFVDAGAVVNRPVETMLEIESQPQFGYPPPGMLGLLGMDSPRAESGILCLAALWLNNQY